MIPKTIGPSLNGHTNWMYIWINENKNNKSVITHRLWKICLTFAYCFNLSQINLRMQVQLLNADGNMMCHSNANVTVQIDPVDERMRAKKKKKTKQKLWISTISIQNTRHSLHSALRIVFMRCHSQGVLLPNSTWTLSVIEKRNCYSCEYEKTKLPPTSSIIDY